MKQFTISVFVLLSCLAYGQEKPNILVIFGDDIGYWNLSYNNRGMMGYMTPNIDRIAHEGMIFTDYYAEQSCTAGRAAFITGQHPFRTGLTKVGMPGAPQGIQKEDPTLAELLKPHGYVTGQFGKNHLGDRDEHLPTAHGFDEFFGNLYHLNAEEEPENVDYPKDPQFAKKWGPRGVIKSTADGPVKDTGPLTKKRMETIDGEFTDAAIDFIKKSHRGKQPFFVWLNTSRMHYFTHISDKNKGISGEGGNFYSDGMVEHDNHVGKVLDALEDLKIDDNTIVIYSTDNGPHFNEWPDGGITPFRGEKNTNWEGGFRVPTAIRWPGKIKPNSVTNEIVSHQDWVPTLMAAIGEPNIKQKLLNGHKIGNTTYNVHLDGHNILDLITGKSDKSPRDHFFYVSDDGKLLAIRTGPWKAVFAEQRAKRFDVWRDPFVDLRAPKLFHLRRDPFERADTDSNQYNHWWGKRAGFIAIPLQEKVGEVLETLKAYPPRQKPGSFNLDQIMEGLQEGQ
ncbi:arylsulfatase [Sediminicola luteus]|uniref:Arylsulfatase n=1 Tax=Sediminicola luteus TaxID=319238 RepID=A0A2A4G6C2_9FLAO|nr:arylsulfatase [Sediminicola luteus]PCE64197.1 arylsulfatase [Sediminicola luteus]